MLTDNSLSVSDAVISGEYLAEMVVAVEIERDSVFQQQRSEHIDISRVCASSFTLCVLVRSDSDQSTVAKDDDDIARSGTPFELSFEPNQHILDDVG